MRTDVDPARAAEHWGRIAVVMRGLLGPSWPAGLVDENDVLVEEAEVGWTRSGRPFFRFLDTSYVLVDDRGPLEGDRVIEVRPETTRIIGDGHVISERRNGDDELAELSF